MLCDNVTRLTGERSEDRVSPLVGHHLPQVVNILIPGPIASSATFPKLVSFPDYLIRARTPAARADLTASGSLPNNSRGEKPDSFILSVSIVKVYPI